MLRRLTTVIISLMGLLLLGRALVASAEIKPVDPVKRLTEQVIAEWKEVPSDWTITRKVQALEQSLRWPSFYERGHETHLADIDGDAVLDLMIAYSHSGELHREGRAPLLLFRGKELSQNRIQPHLLEGPGYYPRVERTGDLTGDGRPDFVISRVSTSAYGGWDWYIYQWDGSTFQRLFFAGLIFRQGTSWIAFEPGKVIVTCRAAFGPDSLHEEIWNFTGGRYAWLSSRTVPEGDKKVKPPSEPRQCHVEP